MEKNLVRKFLNKYVLGVDIESKHEVLTRYVSVDKKRVLEDKDKIVEFFQENFFISGETMCYKDLLFDRNLDRWLTIYDRNSLALFEDLIAVGYEANIFINDMSVSLYNLGHLKKSEMKFFLPEEFEYIDEEYYEGLNKYIIDKCIIRVDQDNYSCNYKRKIETKRLLEYWFLNNNIDKAVDCNAFFYYLENDIESLLDMATFVDLHKMGPLALLLDLNHNINLNIYVQVEYFLKSVDKETRDAFYKCREIFLSDLENELCKELKLKQKKRGN